MSYGGGYDQYNNNQYGGGNYGQPQQQQQWGQPSYQQQQPYDPNQYNQQQPYGGPPSGPPPNPGYGGGYDQNQQWGQNQNQSQGYYGGAQQQQSYGADQEPPSNEDLPYPWVREWDEQFKTIYYVNPTTTPPTTSWTHPGLAPGQVHPEQTETTREAEQMYAEADGPSGQPGERGLMTKAAVGFVGYKALKHLLNNKNSQGGQQQHGQMQQYGQQQHGQQGGFGWGTALAGAGAGVGGAFLLSKLFNGKNTSKYGHQMGPPPFMAGGRW